MIGPFDVEFIPVTHSVPHGFATAFHTPQGVILHTGDFKLDMTPVDGRLTDLARVGSITDQYGIRLLLADSTNADQKGTSRSESSVGKVLYDLFHEHEGRRIITACFASHVHRVQQIADAAMAHDRVIATMGMSMKKNMRLAREMGLLRIPENKLLDIEDIRDLDPANVCIISHRVPGRAHVGAGPHGRQREQVDQARRRRHGDHELAPHPGQRVERVQGDRRAVPAGGRGRALGHRGRARHGPRQGRGAQDLPLDRQARVVHPGARRVPPPGVATPASPSAMGMPAGSHHDLRGRRPGPR